MISEANEESSLSNPEEEHRSLTEKLWNVVEKLQVSTRLTRLIHHRPIIYTFCATLLGITFLPLVIFLLVVCGSFGFGLFIFAVLEGGIIATATIALLISLIIPLLGTIFITTTSYVAYKTMKTLQGFVWRFFGAPVFIFRSLVRKVNDLIDRDDKGHTNDTGDTSDTDAHLEKQGLNDFGTRNSFRIKIVPARRHRTWRFSEDEFLNSRGHGWREVEDDSEDLGIAEGILLYMANFLRTLMSLLMVIFLLQVFLSKLQENCY